MEQETYSATEQICRGLVRQKEQLPKKFKNMLQTAETAVVSTFAPEAKRDVQEALIEAIELNLSNQKDWPYDTLQRKFLLPYSRKAFIRAKQLYVRHIAKRLGLKAQK